MKKSLFFAAVLLFAVSGFASTTINNFNGYSDFWFPYGSQGTQTYGELFSAPTNGDTNLTSFSFYMGTPTQSGSIVTGAYIATWTGSHAGSLLFSSPQINYDNLGDEQITVNTGGLGLQSGGSYVMFLSTSNYPPSNGLTHVSQGGTNPNLHGFAYYNNTSFDQLFTNNWDATGLSPDWAVDLEFNNGVPEPGSLMLLGTGLLGGLGMLRRKLF